MDNEIAPNEEPPSSRDSSDKPPGWSDWIWQLANRIKSVNELKERTGIAISAKTTEKFPLSITPYYFSLIRKFDYSDPIFKMCVPHEEELTEIMQDDPLCEDQMTPVSCLVHRYNDRALVFSTSVCSVYCRYCTRKRSVGVKDHVINDTELNGITDYLSNNPQISDVIVSGGDPFMLGTDKLVHIIEKIRSVKSVDIIRIGTKMPVVLPHRITNELVDELKLYHPIFVNTHFNHPNEFTKESKAACERLVNNGFVVGNQSVLLRGVNDDKHIQEELCRGLVKMRVRPYYLFQCDLVQGVEHFRTRVSKGIEIMEHLRGRLSGLAIPQFVVDSPGGKGKIPVMPTYLISQTPEKVVLRNYRGELVDYPEPAAY